MRYMLLINSDKTAPPPQRAEIEAIVQGHGRFSAELQAAGKMVHGERLRPDEEASQVRLKGGQRHVTDGPFTETKEVIAPSPVVELNRAVAIGLAGGPAAGLSALDGVDAAALRGYHLLPAARADFLRWAEAAAEYRRALALTGNGRERQFYSARLAACEAGGKGEVRLDSS